MPQKIRDIRHNKLRLERKKALESAAAAAWNWNVETGEAVFASEWADILAIQPGRLGKSVDFILARFRDTDKAVFEKAAKDLRSGRKDVLDLPVRMRRFDKTWAWVLLRGRVGGDGVFSGVGVEVSRLRLNKRFFPPSLDDSLTTYQSILEHSPNNIIRFDRELFPLYTNPAVAQFIPCGPEDLGAKKAAELGLDPNDLEFVQNNVERVYASGDVVKVRRSVQTVHGNVVGDYTFWPEFDSKNQIRSVLCLQQDLTAEVAREREAYMNELRFTALYQLTQMNNAPEGEVLRFVVEKIAELTGSPYSHLHFFPGSLGAKPSIVWSKSHESIFGEEYLDRYDPAIIKSEFGFQNPFDEPYEPIFHNEPSRNQSHVVFKDRLPIRRYLCAPALESGVPMCTAAVYNKKEPYNEQDMRQLQMFINGAWLVLRRRMYVEQLKQAKESAETANRVKDRFLANVSHELRTPLNGMLSMLQLLELSNLTPEQVDFAHSAANTGQTLLRIISDILDFSKMASGRLELDSNPFDLKECLESATALFQADAKKRGLGLKLTLAGEFPGLVNGDEARVRQILFNLVGNSLKFTEKGEVEIFCESRPESKDRARVHLSVRDTGIGIPPDMQSRVFDAFTQVDSSSTRKHQGSGLGLGIVRELVRIMGGTVTLSSFPGRGTLVECVLPFEVISQYLPNGTKAPDLTAGAAGSCPSLAVLVAEDDAVSRMAMRLFLERLGHKAVCVSNGKEALEALRLYPFDCLISDVLMPELDGLEVTRHIREGLTDSFTPSEEVVAAVKAAFPLGPGAVRNDVPRDLPIVAVSAHAMKGDREHFLAQGMDYYLSKPAKITDLDKMLQRVYRQKIVPKECGSVPPPA